MNLFATADYQIKANVRNETPEYALGDREGKGDEDYSQKRWQTFLNFSEIDLVDAAKHRRAHEQERRRGRVERHHPRERRKKEPRQKAECGEVCRPAGAAAAVDPRDAF